MSNNYYKSRLFTNLNSKNDLQPEQRCPDEYINRSRLIELYSFEGDIILDPFMGSGTTALVAIKYNRNYIGFEKNLMYIELAKTRIAGDNKQADLFDD